MTSYDYDAAGRVIGIEHKKGTNVLESVTYTYDQNGNRRTVDRANMAAKFPSTTLTSCEPTDYTWDARHRLVEIDGYDESCQPLTASFRYDAFGRRIEKTVNGETVQYVYDGWDIAKEIRSGDDMIYIRTLNIDEPLARIDESGNIRYYHADAQGSILALTDEDGVVKTQYNYSPFGETEMIVPQGGEASDNPFQYTGRENDETGLYYYRYRYYEPSTKRFIAEDPIGFSGGLNFYSYVGNNPVNFVDPLGLFAYVNVSGNDVTINIPITFTGSGASQAVIQKFIQGIQQQWSGTFGKYNVKTCVSSGPENNISVPQGNNGAFVFLPPGNKGTWPSQRPAWTAAHEAGHLMGLVDKYDYKTGKPLPGYAGNIMGQRGGVPSAQDIVDIINSNYTSSANSCVCP